MGPQVAPTDSIASAAKPAIALLGLRAALPAILYVVPLRRFLPMDETGQLIYTGIKGLLAFIALIFYFLWFSKFYTWVRATKGGTRYSNAFAIGGWFIPFANFVIPYSALRDAVRRGANDENGGLVGLWWGSYLALIVLSMVESVGPQAMYEMGLNDSTLNLVFTLLYWSQFLLQMVAWGTLAFLVNALTKKATG